jgi:hypothetical protein
MSDTAAQKRTLSPAHLAALAAGRERRRLELAEEGAVSNIGDTPPWAVKSLTRRFTADMIDSWLLGRLNKIWPGVADVTWRGRFLAFGQSNEYLPICNDRAVLLAEIRRQPMSGRPIVWEVLAWSRDAEDDWLPREKGQALFALYQHARQWMDGMNGERLILGVCSDLRGDTIARVMIEQGNAHGGPLVDILGRRR